jgi:L-fuconolactonase
MKIDSHQHFWKYDAAEYAWISQEQTILQLDFLPSDLDPILEENGIDGSIAVQARQTIEETRWLIELSEENPKVKGVVGWVPLCRTDLNASLDLFTENTKLVGVRHVIHDEEDDDFILRKDFNEGIRELESRKLIYDILIFEKHLPQTIQFVDQHPNLKFVVDHIAKPKISAAAFDSTWAENILELSKRTNVACKLSGMVTEVIDSRWDANLLQPYVDTVLEAFGPDRIMAGSDWPVCLLRAAYTQWHQTIRSMIESLSEDEQSKILGLNACRIYRI